MKDKLIMVSITLLFLFALLYCFNGMSNAIEGIIEINQAEKEFCWSLGMSRLVLGKCTDEEGVHRDIGLLRARL